MVERERERDRDRDRERERQRQRQRERETEREREIWVEGYSKTDGRGELRKREREVKYPSGM